MGQENIVRYWHAVELLQPQSAPKVEKRAGPYFAFIHDTPIEQPIVPWSAESIVSKQQLPDQRTWSHTLFAHIYDSRRVAKLLEDVCGADQGYKEPQSRESALFAAKFTVDGEFVDDSFTLSSEAWFVGRVLKGKDWTSGFADDQRAIYEHAKTLLGGQVTVEALRELTFWILELIGVNDFFGDINRYSFRFRSQPVKPKKPEQENAPLNSFILDDLSNVASCIKDGKTSEPLNQFLSWHDQQRRLRVDDEDESPQLIRRLMPDSYPLSCWPSEKHLGLVHSQQLAVNTTLATLGTKQGLLGINGPPGTGKTTLLRDLIASIVTDRADALAKLNRASDAFLPDGREKANDGGKEQACFTLNSSLFGFEIVIASSNNGAVENVTLELPQRDKIDESWLPEAEYFADLGELVSDKPAWGLISGALGSKARRSKFVDRYFFGQRPFDKLEEKTPEAETRHEQDDAIDRQFFSEVFSEELETANARESDSNASPSAKKPQRGLLGWLNAKAKGNKDRNPQERKAIWAKAVNDYEAAKEDVRNICTDSTRIRKLINRFELTLTQIRETATLLRDLESKLTDILNNINHLDGAESHTASKALKQYLDALLQHQARKPGFWTKLFSLWRAQRHWEVTQNLLKSQCDLAQSDFDRITRRIGQLNLSRKKLESQVNDTKRELRNLQERGQAQKQAAKNLASTYGAHHLLSWLQDGTMGRGDPIELSEPWQIKGWRQARSRVFIQALKLHQTFLELEASRVRSNLSLVNGILTGSRYKGVSQDAIRSAWASLFMVVPVLSSTFASFARSFGSLGVSEIGWLFVDEAGQAPPQEAVGALWRSQRALLVGDPLQLKPIVNVSDAVLEYMRARYKVDAHWLPNRQSAQTLADQATTWGCMAGPVENKTWVGLPLVVHRRCDKPMYELANQIAYDGAMVFGTIAPTPDKETRASLPTGWIQAAGPSQDNWVPAEGEVLAGLLDLLGKDGVEPSDISVITPFKAVRQNLEPILRNKYVYGTIHTMQGKEAPIVVIVLGGDTAKPGARNWAVSEPNLLNVAATRAKRRLYVIGDKNDWKNRALLCDVMELLPTQEIPKQDVDLA